ncbi:MAG: DUF262 domain-containing protein [Bacteroidales bacterium]|nr:DUF262 domain-containing protein [Bacteroidales bacterium]
MIASKPQNFRSLFSADEQNGVTIPIIQRDYAQGRVNEDVNRIRSRFIDVLYNALVDEKPVTLDFIYGNYEKEQFIPLDGQQRLTTLFLLHYYIGRHEGVADQEMAFLRGFHYKTRVSSRDFCEHLIDFCPEFTENNLSDQILDQSFYLMEWSSDPTVQAMLVMLDDIHSKFKDTDGLWARLMDDAITFYCLSLEEIKVGDELYIKMNSRGKQLTPFEHFKAELERQMKDVDSVLAEEIMHQIDCQWTDLLWPYRNSETGTGNDMLVDDEFMRYIRFISDIISYKADKPIVSHKFDIAETQFSKACPNARDNMMFLEKMFNIWTEVGDIDVFFHDYLAHGKHESGKVLVSDEESRNLFRDCCSCYGEWYGNRSQFPLSRVLLLYGFVVMLQHRDDIADADFRRRLRVVNNLINNSSDTLRPENMNVLMSIVERLVLTGELIQPESGKARFNNRQAEEEITKMEWTNKNPLEADTLFRLEDHPFVNGFIHALGLEHIEWTDRLYSLFDCKLDLVERALLATGDYFEDDSWRSQIGTSDERLAKGVWRSLFSPLRYEEQKPLSNVLASILSRNEVFSNQLLEQIIEDYLHDAESHILFPLRYYLVRYAQQMLPGRYGKYYFRTGNQYDVLMMMTEWSLGGKNYDVFLKTICDMSGGKKEGITLHDYSFSYYNDGNDWLAFGKFPYYLTLTDNTYRIYMDDDILIYELPIAQNEDGIDAEDRVQVGINLIRMYMNND